MSKDTIYRQDAVDAINELHDKPNAWLDLAVEALEKLPSTESERKNGKWIDDKCSACGYKCSACGYRVEPWNNTPYCPSCGAYMRGE